MKNHRKDIFSYTFGKRLDRFIPMVCRGKAEFCLKLLSSLKVSRLESLLKDDGLEDDRYLFLPLGSPL